MVSTPRDRGREHERSIPADRRRREGIHYTPSAIADDVVARSFAVLGRPPARVLDPSCGAGAFLVAVLDALVATGVAPADAIGRVHGIDTDPDAIAIARQSIESWADHHRVTTSAIAPDALLVGDALVQVWPPDVDLVVGNPPFGGQLRGSTVRDRDRASAAAAILGTAAGYADTAGLFLARAVAAVRPGGVVALVQPTSVLAARDAGAVRRSVDDIATVVEVLVPDPSGFDASVHVCVPIVVRDGGSSGEARSWADLGADALGLAPVVLHGDGTTLGDIADATAGFRDEFYAVARFVHEASDDGDDRPLLVTVGSIEPGRVLWGERASTVQRRRFLRPVVDVGGLRAWAEGADGDRRLSSLLPLRSRPKVLVATQSRIIEAVADPSGGLWPAVPVVSVLPGTIDLWHVLAVLVSREATAWTLRRSVGTGLASGTARISARVLAALPVPGAVGRDAWARAAHSLRDGAAVDDVDVLDAMSRAYGTAR